MDHNERSWFAAAGLAYTGAHFDEDLTYREKAKRWRLAREGRRPADVKPDWFTDTPAPPCEAPCEHFNFCRDSRMACERFDEYVETGKINSELPKIPTASWFAVAFWPHETDRGGPSPITAARDAARAEVDAIIAEDEQGEDGT